MIDEMRELREAFEEATGAEEPAAPVAEAAPEPVEAAPEAPEAPESSGRDEKGRFAKAAKPAEPVEAKEAAPEAAKEQPKPAAEAQPATPAAEAIRPPQSWKPLAREHWAKLPPEVQQEVARRERETATVLQETAAARKLHEEFRATVAPFEGMIRAEGSDPLKAVGNLLQTAAALRTAPPAHKAQLVASLVQQFGVPIDALDAALSGQTPKGQPQAPAEYRDPRVDQLFQQLESVKAQRSQVVSQKAAEEMATFAKDREFLEDVREDMADLLEVASRRGRTMSLAEAYDKALQMNPEVVRAMKQREAAKQAATAQAATQRAKAAASSVKTQPSGIRPAPSSQSVDDDLRATLAELSGR